MINKSMCRFKEKNGAKTKITRDIQYLASNNESLDSAATLTPWTWTSQPLSTTTSAAATPAVVRTATAASKHIHLISPLTQLYESEQ